MNTLKHFITFSTLFLFVVAVGCGNSHELTELTKKAIMATTETHSYRMRSLVESVADGEASVNFFEVDFVAPDRYRQKSGCASCPGDQDWYELVFIGDEGYLRSSHRPEWCQLPCDNGSSSTMTPRDHLAYTLEPLNWLVQLQKLPDQKANGFDCWHYFGMVNMDSYTKRKFKVEEGQVPPDALYEGMRRGTMIVEVWVEKSTYLIRQLKSIESYDIVNATTGKENSFSGVITTQFHDYNEPLIIKPPKID